VPKAHKVLRVSKVIPVLLEPQVLLDQLEFPVLMELMGRMV
jgi:hypothetical protein